MKLTISLWQRLLGLLPGELTAHETEWLISPHQHMPLMAQRRALIIINRTRLFAMLFALLTPLWIAVDMVALPMVLAAQLAGLRLLATAAFAWLVFNHQRDGSLRQAYRAMATLFAIPTLFYVASHLLLTRHQLQGLSAAIGTGYAFLPFVLLAGFAIFPLTLLESALFAAPILTADGVAWLLQWQVIDWPSFSGAFWLLTLITGVATLASMSQLAFMIALVNQAVRDPLTGCFSRRSAEEMLDLQFTLARRSRRPLSVAFIDLDHFKGINDRHGHEAGDRALQGLTRAINETLRHGDILTRWGGEEFLLLMPETDRQQALQALARLRQRGLGLRPDGTPLTASIGLAESLADQPENWHRLVEQADARMYHAKQQGRDRIVDRDAEPDSAPCLADMVSRQLEQST
ncbi:MAG: GGDEF domain-containing protein [Pseudogulbenkiania sp.]|nr:GGDEF domain-containing protein [Pseudogulbenkiania sp.]